MTEPVELSGNQCLELLGRHGVGRVAFNTPMGPRIVPVAYRLDRGEIVFQAAPYSELGTYAPDSEVAFEVDEADAAGHCECSVVALGRAEVMESQVPLPAHGGAREGYRWIKVRAHDFTGLRVAG